MASFERRGSSIRAIVSFPDGKRSRTFDTMLEARRWAAELEHKKKGGFERTAKRRTVEDLFMAYLPVAVATDSAKWNRIRLMAFCNAPLGRVFLSDVGPEHIEDWIRDRLRTVAGSTVNRELNLMSAAFSYGVKVRKWLDINPCHGVKRPPNGAPRHRRLLTAHELAAIASATGYDPEMPPRTLLARVGACFFLALETGMRSGEILRLRPQDYDRDARTVYVHALEQGGRKGTRSGQVRADRSVPLTERAIQILDQLVASMPPDQKPRPEMSMPPYIVGMTDQQRDALWRKARDRSGVCDLRFHDTKHEACTRLAAYVDVIALSHAVGTKNLKLLRDTYYNVDAEKIAQALPTSLSGSTSHGAAVASKPRAPARARVHESGIPLRAKRKPGVKNAFIPMSRAY